MSSAEFPPRHLLFYAAIRRIPRGRVATYGQIAKLAGQPRCSRQVGRALRQLPPDQDVPWFRVVSASGEIATRGDGTGEDMQRVLLLSEGVQFTPSGRVNLRLCGWQGD